MGEFEDVLEIVGLRCKEQRIPMLGEEKAVFLADLVTGASPSLIVECGTAIGYSGLWMASRLKEAGKGRVITLELDPGRAHEAQQNFRRAGVDGLVESRVGDAKTLIREIEEEVDFLLLDNDYGNYFPCFQGIESRLMDGATIVADNVGIGAELMADYLDHVRHGYSSETHWFDVDLPWVKRDAMEVSVYQR